MIKEEAIHLLQLARDTEEEKTKKLLEKGFIPGVIAEAGRRMCEALDEGIRAVEEETDRTINADELLRILDIMEADAEEHPEVGLKPAPMIRKLKELVEALAEGGVLLEPGEVIIPLKYAPGGVLRKK